MFDATMFNNYEDFTTLIKKFKNNVSFIEFRKAYGKAVLSVIVTIELLEDDSYLITFEFNIKPFMLRDIETTQVFDGVYATIGTALKKYKKIAEDIYGSQTVANGTYGILKKDWEEAFSISKW